MKKTWLPAMLSSGLIAWASVVTPVAATEQKDIIVGLKALPMLTNKITGSATMAVIYDTASAESKADAENIKKALDAGIEAPGGVKLSATLVSLADLGSKLSGAKLAFLTPGLTAHYGEIASATSAAGILTMSTDIESVKAGKCIIGVTTNPSVTIYFSKTASDAAKIEFSQAFAMLVKQL